MRRDFFGLGNLEQFDIGIIELHNAVVRSPWVLVARADREANAAIQVRRGVEVADGMHNMIEPMRHLTETAPLPD